MGWILRSASIPGDFGNGLEPPQCLQSKQLVNVQRGSGITPGITPLGIHPLIPLSGVVPLGIPSLIPAWAGSFGICSLYVGSAVPTLSFAPWFLEFFLVVSELLLDSRLPQGSWLGARSAIPRP